MPKLKPDTIFPTPEEDKKISAGIASDPDDFELDETWFERAKPASEVFSKDLLAALLALRDTRAQIDTAAEVLMDPQPRG